MSQANLYIWEPCDSEFTGGLVKMVTAPILYLDTPMPGKSALRGRYVEIENASRIVETGEDFSESTSMPVGNACADADGNFLFEPGLGGGQPRKLGPPTQSDRERYIEASHFGEVNTYYHATRIAEKVDKLLAKLGEKSLPKVRVLINAHTATTQRPKRQNSVPDKNGVKWQPVRGAHYRFPREPNSLDQAYDEIFFFGEIQLGPGFRSTNEGWLPRVAGAPYSTNSSHIAGFIYQMYGHHITRHTADFQANALRSPYRQSNLKSATDSAISAYWTASLLGTPHIACWHCRHDPEFIHPSSLVSDTIPAEFDRIAANQPFYGNFRLAAALWSLRYQFESDGEDVCDLLVLAALLNVGRLSNHLYRAKIKETQSLREGFSVFAAAMLHADVERFDGRYSQHIRNAMEARGIDICDETLERLAHPTGPGLPATMAGSSEVRDRAEDVRKRSAELIIPADDELLHPNELETRLRGIRDEPYELVAVGDVMTGGRMRGRLRDHGSDYPFAWVKPVFRRAAIVLANLEGPFARHAEKEGSTRNYAYRVNPKDAHVLRRAGINVVTLANNHVLDCGRDGVRETLETLCRQGIVPIGGGLSEATAHDPALFSAGACRIGLLGYYWNRRTAARGKLPGSARDLPDLVRRDIERLKPCVDRVVVTVHWGVPYDRQPSAEDRLKAHHFIDCGADIVIGHHPHIVQPIEIYRGRPIFYSIGNFAFGSGNSRAESLMLGVRFLDDIIEVDVFPAYVRNRDPRLDYQPKLMRGAAAAETLRRLVSISGESGQFLMLDEFYGRLRVTSSD